MIPALQQRRRYRMGRPLRMTYRGALHHVTMRCNNKEFLFDDITRANFLDVLIESCKKMNVSLHDFCLMTNHVHLLFTVKADDTLSRFMHRTANVFANRFNKRRERKGHLWEGRFASTIVEPSSFLLRCMAYIDLNPVRAGIVSQPNEYPWSGHRHIRQEDKSFIKLHPCYLNLAQTSKDRYKKYVAIISEELQRLPKTLADVVFVGTQSFGARMCKRFGIGMERKRPIAEFLDIGSSLCAVDLVNNYSNRRDARRGQGRPPIDN